MIYICKTIKKPNEYYAKFCKFEAYLEKRKD
jgi:hypothetical protein